MKNVLSAMVVLVMFMVIISFQPAYAAEGWTGFGEVSSTQITGGDVRIKIETTNNPSACSHATWFYFDGASTTVNRFYAAGLTAMSAGTLVRVYVTDTCNQWGHALITNLNMNN